MKRDAANDRAIVLSGKMPSGCIVIAGKHGQLARQAGAQDGTAKIDQLMRNRRANMHGRDCTLCVARACETSTHEASRIPEAHFILTSIAGSYWLASVTPANVSIPDAKRI